MNFPKTTRSKRSSFFTEKTRDPFSEIDFLTKNSIDQQFNKLCKKASSSHYFPENKRLLLKRMELKK